MQKTVTILVVLSAILAILLLVTAAMLICMPELIFTSLRIVMGIVCGIAGIGILVPIIIILHSSLEAKRKDKKDTHR